MRLGHYIADFEDSFDTTNYMLTFGLERKDRTMQSQRQIYGHKRNFTAEQRQKLIDQLRKGQWLGEFTVETGP